MAITTAQSKVKQVTRVQIMTADTSGGLQILANNFIMELEATGVNYSVNVGDPVVPAESASAWLRITYTSIEYLIEEPTAQ